MSELKKFDCGASYEQTCQTHLMRHICLFGGNYSTWASTLLLSSLEQ